MKNIDKMSAGEMRRELKEARVAMIAIDKALSTKQFENIGFYQTAGHAVERWKTAAGYKEE